MLFFRSGIGDVKAKVIGYTGKITISKGVEYSITLDEPLSNYKYVFMASDFRYVSGTYGLFNVIKTGDIVDAFATLNHTGGIYCFSSVDYIKNNSITTYGNNTNNTINGTFRYIDNNTIGYTSNTNYAGGSNSELIIIGFN